jgi:hypothetical protein
VVKTDVATEFAVSPDGSWIAFVEGYQAFVAPLPRAGKRLELGPKTDSLPLRRLTAHAGSTSTGRGQPDGPYALGDESSARGSRQLRVRPGRAGRAAEAARARHQDRLQRGGRQAARELGADGARVVTMRGDEVIDDGVVVIRDNRIAAVGRRGSVEIPAGTTSVDVSGKTIVPGLVDAHWHGPMGEEEVIPQQSWIDYASHRLRRHHAPRSLERHERDLHALRNAAPGQVVAPRIYSTGTICTARRALHRDDRQLDRRGSRTSWRLKAAGAISVTELQQPRREQRQQILEAARQTHMLVVPEGGSLFQLNMNRVVDGHTGVEHALPCRTSTPT